MLFIPQRSELALRRRRVQFPPEGLSDRSKDDGHVPGRCSGLVAADMSLALQQKARPVHPQRDAKAAETFAKRGLLLP
jgi:hypothetical protein